jgi:hypothetical protein
VDHVGQLGDAADLAAGAVDVEQDARDLRVVKRRRQVAGEHLHAGGAADLGEQVGKPEYGADNGDNCDTVANFCGLCIVEWAPNLGRDRLWSPVHHRFNDSRRHFLSLGNIEDHAERIRGDRPRLRHRYVE